MAQQNELIIAVVQRGEAEVLIEAAGKAGATGSTTAYGRGTGVREKMGVLGSLIQPEKEVVFIVVPDNIADQVLDAVVKAGKLEEPGMGIAMTMPLNRVIGLQS